MIVLYFLGYFNRNKQNSYAALIKYVCSNYEKRNPAKHETPIKRRINADPPSYITYIRHDNILISPFGVLKTYTVCIFIITDLHV